ncbi:class I SAM-dependent methyltransferase [Deinococcus puniceus]|uniref:3-demethylubiquinone-9 3-methyltransferase n=1 Tax=Deinococcus puniceus TaxID=1182568 RepID=A0A172TB36_9DEIO|nr:class I SAM-dependent methyltransferase [Deinococcus puniceus]ANE44137.1 3-demethylubiquinone-9 3-methyltransferase [Deinococcus puniceus]
MSLPRHLKETLNSAAHSGPSLSVAQRSNLWPVTAWGYAWWRAHSLTLLGGQAFGLEREAALFSNLCRPQPSQSWLDAGTSTGFYAGVLARAGCRVLAADLSGPMLAEAQRREPSHQPSEQMDGGQIDWAMLNLEASGLPDASFDGVTVGATLNETNDPARFLRELVRLTRPGGQLWLMYLPRTAGPLQTLLSTPALGGLSFHDPAWVARQLPGCQRTDLLHVGAVVFERYEKVGAARLG